MGDLLRRGARGRPGRAALQVPPGAGRRRRDRRPRPGAARPHAASRRTLGGDDWRPRRRPSPTGLVLERGPRHRRPTPAPRSTPSAARTDARAARRRTRPPGASATVVNALAGRRPERDTPAQRRALAAAPLRRPCAPPRRLPRGPRRARRHRQRRHPGHRHRRAARLADDPRRVAAAGSRQVRAVVPVSVHRRASSRRPRSAARSPPHFVDLPVGEPSPVVRLHQVSYSFQAHKETGRAVAANRLAGHRRLRAVDLPRDRRRGSRPPRLRRGFQLASPTCPARSRRSTPPARRWSQTYPVPPLLPGHALAIGVTSYDGAVFYGITADRDLRARRRRARPVPRPRPSTSCSTPSAGARPQAPRGRRARRRRATRAARRDAVYLPATLADLAAARRDGGRCARRRRRACVGRRRRPRSEEYAALMTAADDLRRAGRPSSPRGAPARGRRGRGRRRDLAGAVAARATWSPSHADPVDDPATGTPTPTTTSRWYATQEIGDLLESR